MRGSSNKAQKRVTRQQRRNISTTKISRTKISQSQTPLASETVSRLQSTTSTLSNRPQSASISTTHGLNFPSPLCQSILPPLSPHSSLLFTTSSQHQFHSTTSTFASTPRKRFIPTDTTGTQQHQHTISAGSKGNFDGDNNGDTNPTSFFFNEKPDEEFTLQQRMKLRSYDRQVGLEAVRSFLGTDSQQLGMSRGQQSQFAGQFVEEMEAHRQLNELDEFDLPSEVPAQQQLHKQMEDFDNSDLSLYLKEAGYHQPKQMLKTFEQQNRSQRRFRLRTEGLTGVYSQDNDQLQRHKKLVQEQPITETRKPSSGEKYELDEAMISKLESLNPNDLKLLIDPSSSIYDPILHNTLASFHDEVEDRQLSQQPPHDRSSIGTKNKHSRHQKDSLGHNDEMTEYEVPDVSQIALQYANQNNALGALLPSVGEHGELIFDEENLQNESQLQAFQQHQEALSQDPTVFKYVDDDFEHFIPPGMSINKLVKMNVPTHEILNYSRKQLVEGQLQTNYMGISLRQLNLRFQLDNQKRMEQGLDPIMLKDYKATKFEDLDLTGISETDIRDLHDYYTHFERLRSLKKFEKMKDNPSFDPDDPDWQDDGDDDGDVNENGIFKSTKISKRLLKKKNLLAAQKAEEQEAKMKAIAEQNGLTLEQFKEQQQYLDEQQFDEDPDAVDPDDWALLDQARKAKMVGGKLITREAQFPDHKPTIKALQTFVRTVPLDEPIPRELQRRLNLMLTDADYVKRKDYHFMMNDVEIWYLANRLPVVYSILRRVLVEIRQRIPSWKPERVLEFAAGASPALWAVRDVYYQDVAEYTAVERDGRLALLGQQLTADLGIHIYYRSRLLVNSDGQMEISNEDDNKREKKRSKLTHKQKKMMDKEDKVRKERHLQEMSKKHTLVVSPYALSKQPNKEYRRLLLESLWDQVDPNGGLLVILESTESDASGFNVVRECRDYLLKKYPKNIQVQNDSTITADASGRIIDVDSKKQLVTPISLVEENLMQDKEEGAPSDSSAPTWAQGATKKIQTEEAKKRQPKPQNPGASSILPCSHDRACPMGAMLKLNEEVKKLKKLATEEQLNISLPQVPIKSCMFGQRMLRSPMPNQSPLQDIEIPQFLGDAIIENFSYIVLRRGDIPVVTEDKFEIEEYESPNLPKNKLNLPGGLTREEYLEIKETERQQTAQDEEDFQLLVHAYNENPSILQDLDTNTRKRLVEHKKKRQQEMEEAEIGDFINDISTDVEYDQLVSQNFNDDQNVQDIEARRLAMNIFGANSVDNQESIEQFNEEMFSKLPNMKQRELPKTRRERQKFRAEQAANTGSLNNRIKELNAMDFEIEKQTQLANLGTPLLPADHETQANLQKQTPGHDILEEYDLDVIQKELGYELDVESLQTLREVISEMNEDRALINPKKEFNIHRWSRVLSPPLKRGGHVVFDLCTPDGNFERRVVGREGIGNLGFKQARLSKWGDIWPYQRPMTLKEIKHEQQMQSLANENVFNQVRTSQEAHEKLRELRNLFSTTYTPETIHNIDHFHSRLETMELQGDTARSSKKVAKQAAIEKAQNVILNSDELTFDNMDQLDSYTNKQLTQLQETTTLREQHEQRNLQHRLRQAKVASRDNTPHEYNDINLFNDPSYHEAIPGFDQYDGEIPEGTPGTMLVQGQVIPIDIPGEKTFTASLSAQKLMEDLQSLPLEQQKALGPEAQRALKKMAERLSPDQKLHIQQRRQDLIVSAQDGINVEEDDYDSLMLEELNSMVGSAGNKVEGGSLLDKLRTQADIQRAYKDRMQRRRGTKDFGDDVTDPDDLEEEATPVPTSLSHGVKVDEIIKSVEQKIAVLKVQKKERLKLNKKQAKIALKQREKELIATGLSPKDALIQACQELELSVPQNIKAGGHNDNDPEPSTPMDDFMKLMGQNVEFDDSVLNYQKIRSSQEKELASLTRNRESRQSTHSPLDDISELDNRQNNEDSDFSSYDEHEDVELGASDFSEGEILHKPRKLGQSDSDAEHTPYTGPLDDIDISQLSRGKWAASNSKLTTIDDKKKAQASIKAKLLNILTAQQTDELQNLLDDPELKQYEKKEKDLKKNKYNKNKGALYEGLTRTERKGLQAKQRMKKEFIFSDDEEWDLNEKDNIKKAADSSNAQIVQNSKRVATDNDNGFVYNELEHTEPLSKGDQHALQGAALDIVDHSYRVLPSVLKEKMSVPFTGKRSFAENMELLDQYEHQEIPSPPRTRAREHLSNFDDLGRKQSFVDVTSKNRRDTKQLPKDIHGFRSNYNTSRDRSSSKPSNNNSNDSFSPKNYGMNQDKPFSQDRSRGDRNHSSRDRSNTDRSSSRDRNSADRDRSSFKARPSGHGSNSRRGFASNTAPIPLDSLPLPTNTSTQLAFSTLFRSSKPLLSLSSTRNFTHKPSVLLTMSGQNIPTNPKSSTKVVQIGTGLQHKTLYPSQPVYNVALGTKQLDYSKPTATSMYNTILNPYPTVDLTLNERETSIEASSVGALHKNNFAQAESVSVAGIFRFDGPQPMSTFGIAKGKEMARKLQELAGIKTSSKLDNYRSPPSPGTTSPFINNSAPPMTFDETKEDIVNQRLTSQVLGHDIYVQETDPRHDRRYKPQFQELPGMTFRDKPARDMDDIQNELDRDPEGDEFDTYARDMYIHATDKGQTRHDASGREFKGRLKSSGPSGDTLQNFRNESEGHKRKLASRQKRAEFGQKVEKARFISAKLSGKQYIPRADVLYTDENGPQQFAKSGKRSALDSAANPNNGLGNGHYIKRTIDLKSADLGTGDAPAPFYKSRESDLQKEIDEVKQLRRERQRKMLTPLALQDDLPRDPEGKVLASYKAQPSIWAQTVSEKRASMAIIENPNEAEVRHHRESLGLDYSYTALLTNQDGFGPKMDSSGKMVQKTSVVPMENNLVTIEDLENLVKYSDPKERVSLKKALDSAHRELLTNKQLQKDNKDLIRNHKVKQIPFKIQLQTKQSSSNEQTLLLGSKKAVDKQTFDYEIRSLNTQELALLHAERQSALQQPDLRKDVENLLTKHQEGLTFKQKQSIISEDVEQQMKLSLSTAQLGQLARRFTQMAQKQEDRDVLKGNSDSEFAFEPPEIPDMQSSWAVKNRTPEKHAAATAAADHFVRHQRKFDKLIAEVQEIELLDRLRGTSMKIPEAIMNQGTDGPFNALEDKLAKEMLIKRGIKTTKQIELEELRDAISFEKGMQQAIDENYGDAKKMLKHKLQKMAREENVSPKAFQLGSSKGLLVNKSLDEQIKDRVESQKATQTQLAQQQNIKNNKQFFSPDAKQSRIPSMNQPSPKFQKLTSTASQFDDVILPTFHDAEIVGFGDNFSTNVSKKNTKNKNNKFSM